LSQHDLEQPQNTLKLRLRLASAKVERFGEGALEPDSKGYLRAKRLMANWIAARVTNAARVSARFW
jgi:hypothetical protein